MRIWGILLIILALGNLGLALLVAVDKIKPSKLTQVLYYIIVSISLVTSALRAFQR